MNLFEIKTIEGIIDYCFVHTREGCNTKNCEIRKINKKKCSKSVFGYISDDTAKETLERIFIHNRKKKLEKLLA